jgi:serine/threonine protein kinase
VILRKWAQRPAESDYMILSPGTRLGPYEIVSPLGAGGMGTVYRAHDTRLGRTVAVKLISSNAGSDPQARMLFEREGRAIAALNHPHICAIYDVGHYEDHDFLVMEHVDGETLEQRLRRGPAALDEWFRIAIGVAEALVAAHRAGIIHRDLKPSNVMLTRGGVKLMDFGIAKRRDPERQGGATIGPDATAPALATLSGSLVGTVPYMAPEQLEAGPIDARTDIFAFGVLLFEMATGTPAFSGASPASYVAAILAEARPRASQSRPDLPRSVDRIISVCLARDPDSRWQDATDLLRQLRWAKDDLLEGDPATVSSPGKKRLIHAYWGAAVLTLVAALAYVLSTNRDPSPPPNPQPVIVLMDSPLPGRVYDPQTAAEGGTNADDITDALRALPVAIRKENTSAVWHREEQVLLENPDLIISHHSCFVDERVGGDQPAIIEHLSDQAEFRLMLFFAYVAARNPRTHFIVYSRRAFQRKGGEAVWLASTEANLPILRGRLHPLTVPGGRDHASFRQPATQELIRTRVIEVLAKRNK